MDSILLKALCKDTHQRYASASQLSADLALYLDGAPVKARLGGMYRFGRELNRYRVWVAAGVFLLGAVVSGAINVNWSAIWIAAGVLAGFALWHAAADKEFGRRVAESSMWPVLTGLLTAATLIWCLLGANISAGINSARGGDGGVIVQFASASWFIGCAGIGLLFLRWTLRELWAGKLVTAASSKRSRALGIFALLLLLYVPFKLVLWGLLSGDFALPVMPVLSSALEALPWFLLYFLSGRLEFRQSGIVTPTGFYRWSKIESYAWDATGERLRLRIPRAVPFLPDITQRIPAPMREDVKRVLARFLSEWPSQTC
jgi:hypothetical protein